MSDKPRSTPSYGSTSGGGGSAASPSSASGDPSLDQILAQFGLGNIPLNGGGDPYAIFTGNVDATAQVGIQNTVTRRARSTGLPEDRNVPGARVHGVRYGTVGEVLKGFYKLSPDGLRMFQALLFAGGFYGNANITDIQWGLADETTFSAYAQAVARTARMNAAGQAVTYQDVIRNAAQSAGLDLGDLDAALSGSNQDLESLLSRALPGKNLVIALSDPTALRSTLDQTASAVLGRKSNAAEQRMFITAIHNMQRSAQTTQQTAVNDNERSAQLAAASQIGSADAAGFGDNVAPTGDQVVSYTMPDAQAQAEAQLRAEHPAEAGAHDIALQYANLLELLKSPVNVPHITAGGT